MSKSIQITSQKSRLAGASVADPVITYCGRRLVIDGNVPVSLIRLIPNAWGAAKPAAWTPLIDRAIVLGLL